MDGSSYQPPPAKAQRTPGRVGTNWTQGIIDTNEKQDMNLRGIYGVGL